MEASRRGLSAFLPFTALLPALIIGVLTMRLLGVATMAWSANLAAAAIGLLVFAMLVYARSTPSQWALHWMAFGSITAILATFVTDGLDGVHRWVSVGGLELHASAVVAPVLIACVATALSKRVTIGVAVATALLLAVQPDAAQAISFAAACAIVLIRNPRLGPRERIVSLVALTACSIGSLLRPDPLPPVRHVEGIVEAVNARGAAWALAAMVALLLLPMPFFVAWLRHRQALTLGLGVYVTLMTIAPAWGTFPVPIMGYGVSPILGYCVALAFCVRSTVRTRPLAALSPPDSNPNRAKRRSVHDLDKREERAMSYVVRFTPENMSAGKYDEIIQRLEAVGANAPKGRLFHVAFGDPNALRVSDIWDSKENFEAFGSTLMPILQEVGVDPGEPDWIEAHNIIAGG